MLDIIVTAAPNGDMKGIYTPQTFWPANQRIKVQVVDADDDPPCAARTNDAPGIVAHDGYQIGRKTFKRLRETPGLLVNSADGTNAVDVTEQYARAESIWKAEEARLKGIIEQQGVEILRLKPFEGRGAEQEQTIADLRARLSRGAQPKQQHVKQSE